MTETKTPWAMPVATFEDKDEDNNAPNKGVEDHTDYDEQIKIDKDLLYTKFLQFMGQEKDEVLEDIAVMMEKHPIDCINLLRQMDPTLPDVLRLIEIADAPWGREIQKGEGCFTAEDLLEIVKSNMCGPRHTCELLLEALAMIMRFEHQKGNKENVQHIFTLLGMAGNELVSRFSEYIDPNSIQMNAKFKKEKETENDD